MLLIFITSTNYKKGVIRTKTGERVKVKLEVASSYAKQSKGLSKRNSICPSCGMLFVYKKPMKLSFWMRNTTIRLDLAFLDQDMKIQEIVYDMEPLSRKVISSSEPSYYALEVNHGYFEKNDVSIGDRLIVQMK